MFQRKIGKAIALLCLRESVAIHFSVVKSRREADVQGGAVEVDTSESHRRKANKNDAATPHPFSVDVIVGVDGYVSTSTESPQLERDSGHSLASFSTTQESIELEKAQRPTLPGYSGDPEAQVKKGNEDMGKQLPQTASTNQQDNVRVREWPEVKEAKVHEWSEVSQVKGNASSALQNRATSANPTSIDLMENSLFEDSVSRKYYKGSYLTSKAAEEVCQKRFEECTSTADASKIDECMSFDKTNEEDKKLMVNNGAMSRDVGWAMSQMSRAVPNFHIAWDVNFVCPLGEKTCQEVCMEEAPKQVSLAIVIRKACAEKKFGGSAFTAGTPVTKYEQVIQNFLVQEWSGRKTPSDKCDDKASAANCCREVEAGSAVITRRGVGEGYETCCEIGFAQVLQEEANLISLTKAEKIGLASLRTEIQEMFRTNEPIVAALHRRSVVQCPCDCQCHDLFGGEYEYSISEGPHACTCAVGADTFHRYSESILGTADTLKKISPAKKTMLEVKKALEQLIAERERKIAERERTIREIEKAYQTIVKMYGEIKVAHLGVLRNQSLKLDQSNLDASSCDDLESKCRDSYDAVYDAKGVDETGCICTVSREVFLSWYSRKIHQVTDLKNLPPEELLAQMDKFKSLFEAQIETAKKKLADKAQEARDLYYEVERMFKEGSQTMKLTKVYFAHEYGSDQPSTPPSGEENQPCSQMRMRCRVKCSFEDCHKNQWRCQGDGCRKGSTSDECTCVVNQQGFAYWRNEVVAPFKESYGLDDFERAIYSMREFKRMPFEATPPKKKRRST